MNLKMLANAAQTSVATVSKALSGSREISSETRERIFRLAREAGCFEKYYKGQAERPLIALLFPELESEYYCRQVAAIEREIHAAGGIAVCAVTSFDEKKTAELFSEMVYRMHVDGVILIGSGRGVKNADGVPLILLGSNANLYPEARALGIGVKYSEAISDAVDYLKEKGHRSVGFIGEPLTEGKCDYFRRAMRRAGLAVRDEHIVSDASRFEVGGYEAMRRILEAGKPPSAFIAAYDSMAIGAIRALRDAGYRVPEDVSIIGMDDLSAMQYLETPLTTLRFCYEEIARDIARLILDLARNGGKRPKELPSVNAKLCVRSSVAPCRY